MTPAIPRQWPSDVRSIDTSQALTPGEVAHLFKVDPKTVTRWDRDGKFEKTDVFRTLGGHRRFKWGAIDRMLAKTVQDPMERVLMMERAIEEVALAHRATYRRSIEYRAV